MSLPGSDGGCHKVVTRLSQGGCVVSLPGSDGGCHKMFVCHLHMTIISLKSRHYTPMLHNFTDN